MLHYKTKADSQLNSLAYLRHNYNLNLVKYIDNLFIFLDFMITISLSYFNFIYWREITDGLSSSDL